MCPVRDSDVELKSNSSTSEMTCVPHLRHLQFSNLPFVFHLDLDLLSTAREACDKYTVAHKPPIILVNSVSFSGSTI